MSQWIEVSIQTTHEAADLVAEIMRAAGANNGVVIEDPVLINTLRNSGTWELCDIPEQEIAATIREAGGEAVFIQCDVTKSTLRRPRIGMVSPATTACRAPL